MATSTPSGGSGSERVITRIVLVSGSPRRRALLEQLGVAYVVSVPGVDESVAGRMRPTDYVRTVVRRKITAYIEGKSGPGDETEKGDGSAVSDELEAANRRWGGTPGEDWALAADTVVAFGGRIVGKPTDIAEAEKILRMLSGRSHRVITAIALYDPHRTAVAVRTAITRVTFARLSDEELEWYLRSGEWQDVAGGYRIQERGSVLVRKIAGSYSNVVGLPLETFYGMVVDQGYHLFPTGG